MFDNSGKQMSSGNLELSVRRSKDTFPDKAHEIIDWKPIERAVRRNYKKKAAADGRSPYPDLALFKMLLIQRWHNLSDPGLEAKGLLVRSGAIVDAGLITSTSLSGTRPLSRFTGAPDTGAWKRTVFTRCQGVLFHLKKGQFLS
jgi:transposase, IS5 family